MPPKSLSYDDLNTDSLAMPFSSWTKIEPVCIHCSECSKLSNDWVVDRVAEGTCFVSTESCNERRHTGHVDCFLSHISMQERWKLCPHLGIILNISLSWYSPKHMLHLQFENLQLVFNVSGNKGMNSVINSLCILHWTECFAIKLHRGNCSNYNRFKAMNLMLCLPRIQKFTPDDQSPKWQH